jgi:hypothetical protein
MSEKRAAHEPPEAIVLAELGCADTVTMDELLVRLPQLSWTELFCAVDALSRRGEIRIHRRGTDYELSMPGRRGHVVGPESSDLAGGTRRPESEGRSATEG